RPGSGRTHHSGNDRAVGRRRPGDRRCVDTERECVYEIGVRQAARDTGCVMIAADWTKPLVDIDQMRPIGYPMPEGDITDDTASGILQALKAKDALTALAKGRSPVFQSLPWYPGQPEETRKQKMNEMVAQLQKFQEDARAARLAPRKDRAQKAL